MLNFRERKFFVTAQVSCVCKKQVLRSVLICNPYGRFTTWVYLVGEHKDLNIEPIRILNNGYRAKSLVKYGLEEIEMFFRDFGENLISIS